MTSQLELDFHRAMLQVYDTIQALTQYDARKFHLLVRRAGGLRAAKILLRDNRITSGLAVLHKARCLDASMEYLVLQPRWKSLFTEQELLVAASKLRKLGTAQTHLKFA